MSVNKQMLQTFSSNETTQEQLKYLRDNMGETNISAVIRLAIRELYKRVESENYERAMRK